MITCPACLAENPDGARFCNACGAGLVPVEPVAEVRKTVTVLFCDVVGSTDLGERLDPELVQALMSRFYAAVREPVERYGGRVEKVIGDALVAVFGIPVVHEDDALRAIRAALEARDAVRGLGDVEARIGVNTGEVLTRDPALNETLVVGDAVNVAARLEQAASPGEVLVGETTWELVGHAAHGERVGPLPAKGKRDPVHAWLLHHVDADARAHRRRLDAPIIGRDAELDLLRHAVERTGRTQRPHLVMVLGQPGIGKSRLVADLPRLVGGAAILTGQCRDGGAASSLEPLLEVAREPIARLDTLMPGDPDADAIAASLSGGRDGGRDVAWAVSRLIGAMAAEGVVVVVLEDVHWADDLLLDVVERLLARTRRVPLLVVCTARPEFGDRRPGWGAGANTLSFTLERLAEDETRRLLLHLGTQLAGDQADTIVEMAEGNPLFAEHLAALVADGDSSVVLPRSLQVLLTARLEALPAAEREVVAAASVVGRDFAVAAIEALAGRDVTVELDGLEQRELVELDGDRGRFAHALLQDAAYGLLPKQRRSELHVRLARWLDAEAAGDAVVGRHLEQAFLLRAELGPLDDGALALQTEAGMRLAAGGRRADALGDPVRARALLERSLALLPDRTPARAAAMIELAAAGWNLLSRPELQRLLEDGGTLAGDLGLRALELRARVLGLGMQPGASDAELLAETDAALAELRTLGDARALATALCSRGELEWSSGYAADSTASALAALDALRSIDEDPVWALRVLVRALDESPVAVATAEATLAGLMTEFGLRPAARSELLQGQAMLALLAGRSDEAWARLEAARGLERDLLRDTLRRLSLLEGLMLYRTGRYRELREPARAAIREIAKRGLSWGGDIVLSRLALAEARLGIFDEVPRAVAAAMEYESRVRASTALAEQLLFDGDLPGATEAARAAVAAADEGDWVLLQAEARATLARALAAAGDPESAEHLRVASALCDAKGVAPGVRSALGLP